MQVVEATTANGLCTLRVRALPIPSQVASALDNHADLLRRLFDAPSASAPLAEACSAPSQGAAPASSEQNSEAAQGDAVSLERLRLSENDGTERRSLDGSWTLLKHPAGSGANGSDKQRNAPEDAPEQQPQEGAQQVQSSSTQRKGEQHRNGNGAGSAEAEGRGGSGKVASAAAEGAARDVDAFRSRLRAAANEAGASAETLLQQAWLLGPKQVRPLTSISYLCAVILGVCSFVRCSCRL